MKTLLNNFFRGMLIVFPVGATIYLVAITIEWLNSIFADLFLGWINVEIPGLGIITGFLFIALIGYVFNRAFTKPIVHIFERVITKMPLVSMIYTSLKDLTEAFVGERKKFNQPAKVTFGDTGLIRFGFITQDSLEQFELAEQVAVYCPHSYNFSGNLYVVPKECVTPIKIDSTDFMRFIVSGGVTGGFKKI